MTRLSVVSERLMDAASVLARPSVAPLAVMLSLPARSTRVSRPTRVSTTSAQAPAAASAAASAAGGGTGATVVTVKAKMRCEREERALHAVAAVARSASAHCTQPRTSSALSTRCSCAPGHMPPPPPPPPPPEEGWCWCGSGCSLLADASDASESRRLGVASALSREEEAVAAGAEGCGGSMPATDGRRAAVAAALLMRCRNSARGSADT